MKIGPLRELLSRGHLPVALVFLAVLVCASCGLGFALAGDSTCCYAIAEDQPFAGITDIVGVFYDSTTEQIILAGRRSTNLPSLSYDDFAVLRSGLAQPLGVSMEPKPIALMNMAATDWSAVAELMEYDDAALIEALQGDLTVRFIGPVEGTNVGLVMVEADRYLKSLFMGRDTLTDKQLSEQPRFHETMLDLMKEHNALPPLLAWVWYVPDTVYVSDLTSVHGMAFDEDVQIRVQMKDVSGDLIAQIRQELASSDQELPAEADLILRQLDGSNTLMDDFAGQIDENYNAYAKEKPELNQLVQFTKLLAIHAWLDYQNLPVDLSWVQAWPVEHVDTPETSPVVAIKTRVPLPTGAQRMPISGGVDLRVTVQGKSPDPTGNLYIPSIPNPLAPYDDEPFTDPYSQLWPVVRFLEEPPDDHYPGAERIRRCLHIYPCSGSEMITAPLAPLTVPEPEIMEAAQQGIEEESSCIKMLGRAAEKAALAKLYMQGRQASDLNDQIGQNIPVVDISTAQDLIQVKATLARSQATRLDRLVRDFENFFGATADNEKEARRKAATTLLARASGISIPPAFVASDNPAGYIRDNTQFWVPDNLVEPLIQTLLKTGHNERDLRQRIQGIGLNTWDLASLLPERCVSE